MSYPANYMTGKRTIKAPGKSYFSPWEGVGGYDPGKPDDYWSDPLPGDDDPNFWNTDPNTGIIGTAPKNPGDPWGNYTGAGATKGPGSIQIGSGVDYRGILDRYMGDMRARINTGLANMNANKLSNARALINRMGVRDPTKALARFGKYGITAEDLQGAADNPWSELKAITQQADRARGQGEADFAARGGFRSGGTSQMYEDVENQRARNEAMSEQNALQGLTQGEQQMAQWQQEQEDAFAQRAADLDLQLSQQYQPQTAIWDDAAGGYTWGNIVYDQYGNIIRRR